MDGLFSKAMGIGVHFFHMFHSAFPRFPTLLSAETSRKATLVTSCPCRHWKVGDATKRKVLAMTHFWVVLFLGGATICFGLDNWEFKTQTFWSFLSQQQVRTSSMRHQKEVVQGFGVSCQGARAWFCPMTPPLQHQHQSQSSCIVQYRPLLHPHHHIWDHLSDMRRWEQLISTTVFIHPWFRFLTGSNLFFENDFLEYCAFHTFLE